MASRATTKRRSEKIEDCLRDDSNQLSATMKQLLMLASDEACDRVSSAFKQMLSDSNGSGRVITHGSLCSGSGLGMLAVTMLIRSIATMSGEDYSSQCVFACEFNPNKADWLKRMGVQKIFNDVRHMGCDRALDIITNTHIEVPSVKNIK